MVHDYLVFRKAHHVGTIVLNRGSKGNAVDTNMAQEFAALCAEVSRDENVRAVILTGAGHKAFCVGVDPTGIAEETSRRSQTRLVSMANAVTELKMPVIAAINGDAVGLGLELALACDLRIAVDTARFALDQVHMSAVPWDGATQRLPRIVGRAKAMEMLLTGRYVDAAEASRVGLITRMFPGGQLMPAAIEMAVAIASKAPVAVRHAKEAVSKGLDMTLDQGLRLEADLYLLLHTTEDRTEGVTAFLEKRTPRFKGR